MDEIDWMLAMHEALHRRDREAIAVLLAMGKPSEPAAPVEPESKPGPDDE